MSSGDTPAVARRKVRLAIKDARNTKGETQTQVAEAMEWSLSKVMRIESGEVTVSRNDLVALLAHLGVKDRAVVADLIRAAQASRQRRQWWDDRRDKGPLSPAMRQLVSFEAEATAICNFAPVVFPGLLQTEAYVSAVMLRFAHELTEDQISPRVAIRRARREAIRRREPRPEVLLIVDESVLLRRLGGSETSHEQFTPLGERSVPVGVQQMETPFSPFDHDDLPYLSRHEAQAVLYRESGTVDEIVDDAVHIGRSHEAWDPPWDVSIGAEDSARKIANSSHPAVGADIRVVDEGSSA
jgi:transcriptional regulator with XRE-family HTH domain